HTHDAARARALFERYREAFSVGFRESYSPVTAVRDIHVIEGLTPSRPLGVDFHRRAWDQTSALGLKIWSYDRPIPLSERALVLAAGMMWREVALIRAISRFLRQIRVPYSQDYMWATLVKHASIAAEIVRLFHTRFDPRLNTSPDERNAREGEATAAIEAALQTVESLDEDR